MLRQALYDGEGTGWGASVLLLLLLLLFWLSHLFPLSTSWRGFFGVRLASMGCLIAKKTFNVCQPSNQPPNNNKHLTPEV